jgi:poly-gamma-glutamate capsule biosynthesis protein CapA/YwtB (metallophosphatase superfamily)
MISTDFPSGVINPEIDATFTDVQSWLTDADITFGNLEGPVCDTGKTTKCKPDSKPGSCYAFRTPSTYMPLYKAAGFDVMSTANNHASDFGQACRTETEAHLDAQGIAHTGRPGDIATVTANGLKVAFIGFHTSRNSHYVNDHEKASLLVKAVDQEHDLVVVSFHGGAEGSKALHVPHGTEKFYGENRGNLREFTHTVIDAGADLVLGHGPHVLRGMEVYNDRLIAYSLGNFATYGRFNLSGNLGVGAVLEVIMDKDGLFVSGTVLPTKQKGEGIPVKDPDGKAIDLLRTLSTDDFPSTAVRVAQDGALAR